MSKKKSSLTALDEFKGKHYGPSGTARREALEAGYKDFKDNSQAVTLNLADLFGAYSSTESADEMIEEIRSSRVSTRRNELLNDFPERETDGQRAERS